MSVQAKKQRHEVDWGSVLLVLLLIGLFLVLLRTEQSVFYDDAQAQELISCGLYDNGISEYDTLEFYAVSQAYASEFLSIPETYDHFTVDSVQSVAFYGTPIRYVLLPDTIVKLDCSNGVDITMFTDSEKVAALCQENGFQVGSAQEYYDLLNKKQSVGPLSLSAVVPNVTNIVGDFKSFIGVAAILFAGVLLGAKLREKSGRCNPLSVLTEKSFANRLFWIGSALGAFISFYLMLCETETVGFDTESLMETLLNWPLKICGILAAVVLILDIFHRDFFPWYFGRLIARAVLLGVILAIAFGLGAFLGAVSDQFRFIIHMILGAPTVLFYFLLGGGACLLVAPFLPTPTDPAPNPSGGNDSNGFSFSGSSHSGSATTTLIAPDGTSYPVHNVGYGYMVNGKLLRNFDPYGTDRPVDEDGTEYTRY